jgi:hypothetical protein
MELQSRSKWGSYLNLNPKSAERMMLEKNHDMKIGTSGQNSEILQYE